MTKSLRTKLVLSYLAIAIFTAVLIYLLIRLTSDQRLKNLLLEQQITEIQNEVAVWYKAEASWDGFDTYFETLHPPSEPPVPSRNSPPPPELRQVLDDSLRGEHGVIDAEYRVLIRFLDFEKGAIVPAAYLDKAVPVVTDEQTVAWVVPDDESGISLKSEDQVFLRRTNRVLLIAMIVGVCGALLMGFGFSRVLLRPIYMLTKASEAMAQGDLEQRVSVHTHDELGQLAAAFNQMSAELALADQRRRQLTADVTHDLSTPLQVISGYIETMQDGSLPLTPERIGIIATELEQIRRLVNDLSVLAEADENALSLQLQPTNPRDFLERVTRLYVPSAQGQQIMLHVDAPYDLPPVNVDEERMMQVLGNLLNNALRYTPAGGSVSLSAQEIGLQLLIHIQDTGVGIDPDDLPFIFDRFYRADPSRGGNSGKMGLGLAICKALVEMQGGEILAKSAGNNQGTTFTITFPVYTQSPVIAV